MNPTARKNGLSFTVFMAVHNVEMDPVGPGPVDRPHLLAEPREVGRKDRGRDDRPLGHDGLSSLAG
jgi:hypothetical protein